MDNNSPPIDTTDAQRKKVRRELLDALVKQILEDPDSPAELRLGLQIGETGRRICEKMQKEVFKIGLAVKPGCTEVDIAKAQELLEYLQLMEVGFDSFLAAHKEE